MKSKLNEIINSSLLAGDKLMPQMHLRQPRTTCSAFGSFTKTKAQIQKFKETEDSQYIYQDELDKACFQHGLGHGDFKEIPSTTAADKHYMKKHLILLEIQVIMVMMDIRALASMIYKFS